MRLKLLITFAALIILLVPASDARAQGCGCTGQCTLSGGCYSCQFCLFCCTLCSAKCDTCTETSCVGGRLNTPAPTTAVACKATKDKASVPELVVVSVSRLEKRA